MSFCLVGFCRAGHELGVWSMCVLPQGPAIVPFNFVIGLSSQKTKEEAKPLRVWHHNCKLVNANLVFTVFMPLVTRDHTRVAGLGYNVEFSEI